MTALVLGLGALLFGVNVPFETLPGLALALVLGTACLASLGVAFAGVLPSPEAAGPMQAVLVMPITFISGTFFPLDGAPSGCTTSPARCRSSRSPTRCRSAFDPRTTGAGIAGTDLLLLGGWTLVGAFLARSLPAYADPARMNDGRQSIWDWLGPSLGLLLVRVPDRQHGERAGDDVRDRR